MSTHLATRMKRLHVARAPLPSYEALSGASGLFTMYPLLLLTDPTVL